MLERFLRIRDELIEVGKDARANLDINDSLSFRNKVLRYTKQLQEINYTTKYLQTRLLSLSACQDALDMLQEDVSNGFDHRDSAFYCCVLQSKYITPNSDIFPNAVFERGVCKIQSNRAQELTIAESEACSRLLISNGLTQCFDTDGNNVSYSERLDRRKRQKKVLTEYRDCSFILGSVAEVERLWSVADNILRNQRMSLTPLLFEAIIFLRINARLWDVHLVRKAYRLCLAGENH
ncbi:hypothetical protein FGB62_13g233 [Gracilaria domingensis]|nr:hypothetical protein FGB62_13g233 [Gracilaria domingensis]